MLPKRNARSKWFTFGFVGICLVILSGIAALGNAGARSDLAHSYDNLLRLHVVAHSDNPEDQRVKLLVRDALLREMASWPAPADRSELERLLLQNKERLESLAEETLRREGMSHDVRVEIGDFEFPDKRSATVFLPAGEYRAVRVVIGDGAGHNWWCVLFPPLCFVDDGLAGSEANVGTSPAPAPSNRLVWAAPARPLDAEPLDAESLTESSVDLRISLGDEPAANEGAVGEKRVAWRLRLWESLSESAYAGALRGLVQIAKGRDGEP